MLRWSIAAAIALASAAGADELFELAKKVANPLADLATAPVLIQLGSGGWAPTSRAPRTMCASSRCCRCTSMRTGTSSPACSCRSIEQEDVSPGSGTDLGLAGVNLSFFLSPRGAGRARPHRRARPRHRLSRQPTPRSARRSGGSARRRAVVWHAGAVDRRPADPPASGRWGATPARPISTRRTCSRS